MGKLNCVSIPYSKLLFIQRFNLVLLSAILAISGCIKQNSASDHGYVLKKTIQLQTALGLSIPAKALIYQDEIVAQRQTYFGDKNYTSVKPIKICFILGQTNVQQSTRCQVVTSSKYKLLDLSNASIKALQTSKTSNQYGLVVETRLEFAGETLNVVSIFTFDKTSNQFVSILPAPIEYTRHGGYRLITNLKGQAYFISARAIYKNLATRFSAPLHYKITLYRLKQNRYQQLRSYITKETYAFPEENPKVYVINREYKTIVKLLKEK